MAARRVPRPIDDDRRMPRFRDAFDDAHRAIASAGSVGGLRLLDDA
jgi:hypothetical protein